MTRAPAGWYGDGSGRRRWWDGEQWTDRFEEAAPAAATSTAQSRWQVRSTWVLGAFLAGLVIIAAVGGWPGLLVALGLSALGLGAFAVARGSLGRVLTSRSRGTVLLAAGAVALLSGIAVAPMGQSNDPGADPTGQSKRSATPTPSPTPTPTPEVKVERETTPIPFASSTVDDPNLPAGTTVVVTPGTNGTKVTTYEATYIRSVLVDRKLVKEEVTVAPVNEVKANGTYVPPPPPPPAPAPAGDCHPSYADVCVPVASDVDCSGGSGDGPGYASGPLRVVGPDVYDLDRDGDGVACDA